MLTQEEVKDRMKQFNPNKEYMTFQPDDIKIIEEKVLGDHSFNEEQRNFIHFLDSGVIEAGPGSGKTTTLGAKIALLIKHLQQINSNRGICIITHTNAAVKEIESLIQKAGISKIPHPHFIGTISSFVIQFILRPWYKKMGIPLTIHNNQSEFRWKDHFNHCHNQKYNYGLKHSVLQSVLRRLNSLVYEFDGSNVKIFTEDTWGNSWDKLSNYESRFKCSIKKYYKAGSINLLEAQNLASSLITNREYDIDILSKRFPYIFVDEYQDQMHDSFLSLLSDFKKKEVKVQIIGDINQQIYFKQPYYKLGSLPFNYYKLSVTNRFSDQIAKPLNKMFNGNILPANFTKSDKPILYIYDDPEKILTFINFFQKTDSSILVSNHRHANDLKLTTQTIKQNESSKIQDVLNELTNIFTDRLGISKSKSQQILRQNYEDIYIELKRFILNSLHNGSEKEDQIKFLKDINQILSMEKVSNINSNNSIIKSFLQLIENNQIEDRQESSIIPVFTIHGVKGLTFNSVCIYLKEDSDLQNAFLHTYEPIRAHLEIYKRIVYVAMSRPKMHLIVSLSKKVYGSLDKAVKEKIKDDFSLLG